MLTLVSLVIGLIVVYFAVLYTVRYIRTKAYLEELLKELN